MFRRHVVYVPLLIAAISQALPAAAEEGDARSIFREGVQLYESGKFIVAAESFERAYELKPTYKLLFNIGQARAAAGQYDLALQAFERYLVDGRDDVADDRREEVLSEIAKLRPLVGFLEIEAPPGTTVRVDGRERGKTPLKSKLMLTVGKPHEVELLDGGKILLTRDVKVFGGMVEKVAYSPGSAAAPAAPTEPEEKDEEPVEEEPFDETGEFNIWGWTAIAVGGGLLIAGGVVGGLTLSKSKELERYCPDGHCAPERAGEVDALDGMALTTDVLFGAGAAAAIAGVVMLLLPDKHTEESLDEDETVTWRVGPAPGGAAVTGTF